MPPDLDITQAMTESLPTAQALAFAALVVIGVLMWLLGRALARPACAVSGLVLGGLGGWLMGNALADQGALTLPLVIGGAIAGALLAALLFRVWMGLSSAALLAIAAPMAIFVWQGAPDTDMETSTDVTAYELPATQPDDEPRLGELLNNVTEAVKDTVTQKISSDGGDEAANDESSDATQPATDAIREQVRAVYDYGAGELSDWWATRSAGTRVLVIALAALGAGVGLLFGLIGPYVAAAVESALVGSILILLPGQRLLEVYLPGQAGWLPQSWRGTLLVLGLITVLGIAIQWTLFRRQTDK